MRSQGRAAELGTRRRSAVQRVSEGWRRKDVAAFLGVPPETVAEWVRAPDAGGDAARAAKPHPGRVPYLTADPERQVLGWLADEPTAHGFRTGRWTARRVAEGIRRRFAVAYHPHDLREWLPKRNHGPQTPARRDRAAIDRWLRTDGPRIKKGPGGGRPTPSGSTRPGCSSTRSSAGRGRCGGGRRWSAATGAPREGACHRAVRVSPPARRLGRYVATLPDGDFTAEAVVRFLRDLLRQWRGDVVVVWDGGPHHRGPAVRAFRRRNRRWRRERLPPSAPDRNPVEAVWAWLESGRFANHVPAGLGDLDDEIVDRLTELKFVRRSAAGAVAGFRTSVPISETKRSG